MILLLFTHQPPKVSEGDGNHDAQKVRSCSKTCNVHTYTLAIHNVLQYKMYMEGVDVADRLRGTYSCHERTT